MEKWLRRLNFLIELMTDLDPSLFKEQLLFFRTKNEFSKYCIHGFIFLRVICLLVYLLNINFWISSISPSMWLYTYSKLSDKLVRVVRLCRTVLNTEDNLNSKEFRLILWRKQKIQNIIYYLVNYKSSSTKTKRPESEHRGRIFIERLANKKLIPKVHLKFLQIAFVEDGSE